MKKTILTLVAALSLGGTVAAAADAQRTVVRTSHHNVVRSDAHHAAAVRHRTCRTVLRHHRRVRTCRSW